MGASTRIAVATLVVVVLAGAFWLLALAPQRQQAKELGDEITQLRSSLAESQSQATEALEARRKFPGNYQQLVVLGKAVPNSDETSSLLIQLNQIANRSQVRFDSIKLGASSEETTSETAPATVSPSSPKPIPPTEAAAALLPLGATVGTAGLGVMPYNLTFSGDFFHVADFIKGIDSLVKAKGSHIAVNGRLMTLDGFALSPDSELGFPHLQATFAVTTYLTPPSQGVTAGASSVGPSSEVPAASTTATPEAAPSESTASTATPPAR